MNYDPNLVSTLTCSLEDASRDVDKQFSETFVGMVPPGPLNKCLHEDILSEMKLTTEPYPKCHCHWCLNDLAAGKLVLSVGKLAHGKSLRRGNSWPALIRSGSTLVWALQQRAEPANAQYSHLSCANNTPSGQSDERRRVYSQATDPGMLVYGRAHCLVTEPSSPKDTRLNYICKICILFPWATNKS